MHKIKSDNFGKSQEIVIILFSLFLLISFSSCYSNRDDAAPFRIAVVTWVNHGPFYLAKEKGFYEKYGLLVEINKIEDIGAQKLALQSGRLDATISSVDFFATAAAEGVSAKTVMKLGAGNGADALIVDVGISSFLQLKGRTIAVEKGSPDHFFLLLVLDEEGLAPSDVKLRYMTTPDAGAAYVARAVDGCAVWEPWVTNATSKRKSNILATSRDRSDVLVDTFIVRNDVLKKRPSSVKAFMHAWFDAIEYWKAHPDESNQIMARGLGIDYKDFVTMLAGVKLSDYQDNLKYFGTKEAPGKYWDVFRKANKLYTREGIITNPADPISVTDTTFLFELFK